MKSAAAKISADVMLFVTTGYVSSLRRYQATNPNFPEEEEEEENEGGGVGVKEGCEIL